MTQCDAILYHLQHIGAITSIDALEKYGCFRLGARISDLKERGHDIHTDFVRRNGKMFASYKLVFKEEKNGQLLCL